MSNILDGKALAMSIREQIAQEVEKITQTSDTPPGLAVILVGENKASEVYVKMKQKACEKAGLYSRKINLSADITQKELIENIQKLNSDPKIHGILLQLPLPSHLDSLRALEAIAFEKDVDGFNPINVGYLSLNAETFVPCTPLGIMKMLEHYKVKIEGAKALVAGRSNIVGKPVATLLTRANATVTIAHSKTRDLPQLVAQSDIVVAALGKTEFIKGSWIKDNAVVIDVGINSVDDPESPKGYRLAGDVEFSEAVKKAAWITPVPGGVGPMTIAMLLSNTLAARKAHF